ncbi:transcriptional repressor [candidate division WOR-3 bacterium]|nr:transcriptional repressor [candidate division WOR-3 bacterium]
MTAVENVSASLRSQGLKATPKRLAVARLLKSTRGSITPEQVWKRLRPGLGELGLPTVYRILEDLARVGLLTRVELADNALRYAACRARPATHHHHLVCVNCGAVGVVEGCTFQRQVSRVEARTGFKVLGHKLQVEGLCAGCRGADRG